MRDPKRIKKVLKLVEDCLSKVADLTIGKVIDSVDPGNPFLYYCEDSNFSQSLSDTFNVPYDNSFQGDLTNKELLEIEKIWNQVPDMRFTQLVLNVCDTAYLTTVDDQLLVRAIKETYGGM